MVIGSKKAKIVKKITFLSFFSRVGRQMSHSRVIFAPNFKKINAL